MGVTNSLGEKVLEDTIASLISNATHVAIGTGTTAFNQADTTLETEVVRNARQTYSETSDTVTISGYFNTTQANGSDITEYGVFDAATSGLMISRDLATSIAKTDSVEIWVDETYNVTVTLNN